MVNRKSRSFGDLDNWTIDKISNKKMENRLCPFRMVGKEFIDEAICLKQGCELWLAGYNKCSFRLLALLPYLNNHLEKFLKQKGNSNYRKRRKYAKQGKT